MKPNDKKTYGIDELKNLNDEELGRVVRESKDKIPTRGQKVLLRTPFIIETVIVLVSVFLIVAGQPVWIALIVDLIAVIVAIITTKVLNGTVYGIDRIKPTTDIIKYKADKTKLTKTYNMRSASDLIACVFDLTDTSKEMKSTVSTVVSGIDSATDEVLGKTIRVLIPLIEQVGNTGSVNADDYKRIDEESNVTETLGNVASSFK